MKSPDSPRRESGKWGGHRKGLKCPEGLSRRGRAWVLYLKGRGWVQD